MGLITRCSCVKSAVLSPVGITASKTFAQSADTFDVVVTGGGHKTHIEAELSCQTCHGPIEKREKVAMETAVVAMASCIGCHQASDVKADCYTCHAWPSSDVIDYDYSRYLPQ